MRQHAEKVTLGTIDADYYNGWKLLSQIGMKRDYLKSWELTSVPIYFLCPVMKKQLLPTSPCKDSVIKGSDHLGIQI